ncbi:alpha/beta hydrolase [Aureimonas frigidaquae]|uniref:Esterase/lipase n=1 Tax=Aureimonas frigidaquae TaxID=424757 RepID=A0A0N7KY27_9HYPH|nr:alpha/beta hydrolase [Aureimonas frigidaquae]BAT28553.1 esterase/lipase [Aureimonas frigidaquae]
MQALTERIAREDGPRPDPTMMAPAEGRAEAEDANRRWNRNLPPLARRQTLQKPATTDPQSPACAVELLVPHRARPGILIYVHGGGFAFCSPATHERCARVLAVESGLPVLLPDYRLSPEHPFPAGLEDIVSCLRCVPDLLQAADLPSGPVFLSGDSAGANLAVAAMLHEDAAGRALPAGAALFYGVYDADFSTPSYSVFAEGPGLTLGKMQRYWDWYLPDVAERHAPLAAPARASEAALKRLPPLHLSAAGVDPLLSDSIVFAERLAAVGRDETLTIHSGVTHGFLQMSEDLPEAQEALRDAGRFLRGGA